LPESLKHIKLGDLQLQYNNAYIITKSLAVSAVQHWQEHRQFLQSYERKK